MSRVILNGIQFRQLISGQAVQIGEGELLLGDLGFDIHEVETPGSNALVKSSKVLRFIDRRK